MPELKRGLKGKFFGPYVECRLCKVFTNHTDVRGESIGICSACDLNYNSKDRKYINSIGDNMDSVEDIMDSFIEAEIEEHENNYVEGQEDHKILEFKPSNVVPIKRGRGRPKGSKNK